MAEDCPVSIEFYSCLLLEKLMKGVGWDNQVYDVARRGD
jgi:hypothetical protein